MKKKTKLTKKQIETAKKIDTKYKKIREERRLAIDAIEPFDWIVIRGALRKSREEIWRRHQMGYSPREISGRDMEMLDVLCAKVAHIVDTYEPTLPRVSKSEKFTP